MTAAAQSRPAPALHPAATRLVVGAALALLTLGFFGCASAPPTYKTRPESAATVAGFKRIALAPPDVEVREISAGGVPEVRDDWSAQVSATLADALAARTHYAPPPRAGTLPRDELNEVQALVRLQTLNHLSFLFGPRELSPAHRPLTYHVGAIEKLADAAGADALLFVFARDAYSSGGRKTLIALGFAQPAPAFASAMLIGRDGRVQWFNYHLALNTDLRTAAGAQTAANELLTGLPR